MALCIIIYFGLRAGFSLLKLHPLELGSCLNSCDRNELRFPGKGNANLPTKRFLAGSIGSSLLGILSLDRDCPGEQLSCRREAKRFFFKFFFFSFLEVEMGFLAPRDGYR